MGRSTIVVLTFYLLSSNQFYVVKVCCHASTKLCVIPIVFPARKMQARRAEWNGRRSSSFCFHKASRYHTLRASYDASHCKRHCWNSMNCWVLFRMRPKVGRVWRSGRRSLEIHMGCITVTVAQQAFRPSGVGELAPGLSGIIAAVAPYIGRLVRVQFVKTRYIFNNFQRYLMKWNTWRIPMRLINTESPIPYGTEKENLLLSRGTSFALADIRRCWFIGTVVVLWSFCVHRGLILEQCENV